MQATNGEAGSSTTPRLMMRTPEEIKKGLECCSRSDSCPQECPYYDVSSCGIVSKLDVLGYIQQLEDQFSNLTKMIPKWISVDDPPRNDRDVMILVDGRKRMIGYYSPNDDMWSYDGDSPVTHWMPLPEPPKEG